MTSPDPLPALLRTIRNSLRMSLQAVEEKSNGRFKAVVVGSYERGSRQPTVPTARALLDWYNGHRLEVLAAGDIVVREGAPSDDSYVEYLVVYGPSMDGTIGCDDLNEAATIVSYWPGARVAYRTHVVGPVTFVDGAGRQ